MYVDRASNARGTGIGIVLILPKVIRLEHLITLRP